jgi:Holliday junction resolvase
VGKINSRSKGKRGELQWRDFLREHGISARRGAQFQGGTESPDVVSPDMPGWHVEVKNVECFNLYKALEQALEDSAGQKIPYVAHKRNHKPWVVVIQAETFIELLKRTMSITGLTTNPTSSSSESPSQPLSGSTTTSSAVDSAPGRPSSPSADGSALPAKKRSRGTGSARSAKRPRSAEPGPSATSAPLDESLPTDEIRSSSS